MNGRNYFVLSGSQRTRPPLANESYLSPRTRDQVVPSLTNETITAFDVSYLARYTRFKARVSAFYTQFNDRIDSSPFYHEQFQTFVNYVMTDIDRLHTGIEFGMEYNINCIEIPFKNAVHAAEIIYNGLLDHEKLKQIANNGIQTLKKIINGDLLSHSQLLLKSISHEKKA
jgi:hypothetical protein